MNAPKLAALIVLASLLAWGLFMGYDALVLRRRGAPAGAEPTPSPRRRGQEELEGVTRRQFLNRVMIGGVLVSLGQFGMASLDFLWPRLRGGFGAKINLGNADQLKDELAGREPKFIADGRFWLAVYEGDPDKAEKIQVYQDSNTVPTGIVAMYRKCPHLGCSVPWCAPSKWFECPCHGSKYTINGEYREGPAPRGLDRFRVQIVNGDAIVDTGTVLEGPPRGTLTSQPQPEGEHCVTIAEE